MRSPRTSRSIAVLAAGALLLSACGSDNGNGDAAADGDLPPLIIDVNDATSYQSNFNPFSSTVLAGAQGFIYEPLMINSAMSEGETEPWLAESMEFNEDGTAVTFTLREGVEWSDGETFDAEDVAFTFEMMVEHPATNMSAFAVSGAEAIDEHTAEVTFDETMYAREEALGNTLIVPEHIWSELDDPTEFTNDEPVGTGPFELDQFGEQLYVFTAHEGYWNADAIQVEEVHYPASTSETITSSLRAGDLDWAGHYVPNIEEIFVQQDPDHHGFWYPGGGTVTLFVNHEREIFQDRDLREALSLAVDRQQLAEVALQDLVEPAHPTGLPLPTYEEYMAAEYEDDAFERDIEAANQILDDAGYETGSDGIRQSPDGEPLSWEIEVPSDYADFIDITQMLEEQFADIGVDLTAQGVSVESYTDARGSGNFDLTLASPGAGQTPYDLFQSMMSAEHLTDDIIVANYGRYDDQDAEEALAQYRATEDDETRQEALEDLQTVMMEDVPVIPLLQAGNWFNYNTSRWTGFPDENDPYAFGAPNWIPDILIVLQNLEPAE